MQHLASAGLDLAWVDVPWDTAVLGYPVLHLERVRALGAGAPEALAAVVARWKQQGVGLVSCRLPMPCSAESMLLESAGFRFVEVVYRPEIELGMHLAAAARLGDDIQITPAQREDLPVLLPSAAVVFRMGRLHSDPRIDSACADIRYQRWVETALTHATQRVWMLWLRGERLGFFVTEMLADGTCYWHLNALLPRMQGQGHGKRVWMRMLEHAGQAGAKRVATCITAHNCRALSLYARLGFTFAVPWMTLHWHHVTVA